MNVSGLPAKEIKILIENNDLARMSLFCRCVACEQLLSFNNTSAFEARVSCCNTSALCNTLTLLSPSDASSTQHSSPLSMPTPPPAASTSRPSSAFWTSHPTPYSNGKCTMQKRNLRPNSCRCRCMQASCWSDRSPAKSSRWQILVSFITPSISNIYENRSASQRLRPATCAAKRRLTSKTS